MIEPRVRVRVDFGAGAVGIGKIELLEGIARTGSLSAAARQMRMSYRRAWLLLADLNQIFEEPVSRASTGGRGGGGVVLTPFGERLVAGYRQFEAALEPIARASFSEFSHNANESRARPRKARAAPKAPGKRPRAT